MMPVAVPPQPPAAGAPLVIGFAPPLGQVLRYETEERRPAAEGERRFTMRHEVRFFRTGDGYRMEARMVALSAQAPPAVARRYEAGMRPFVGVPVMIALALDGTPRGVIDADATWAKVVASLAALTDRLAHDPSFPPERLAAARSYVAQFAAMPAGAREAALSGWLTDLLAPKTLPRMPGDSIPYRPADASSGSGTMRLEAEDAETARFSRHSAADAAVIAALAGEAAHDLGFAPAAGAEADAAAGAGLIEDEALTLARRSGLLIEREARTRLGGGAAAIVISIRTVRQVD